MLFSGTNAEAAAVLRAMRTVAAGSRAPTTVEQAALDAAAVAVFRLDAERAADLEPIDSATLAAAVGGRASPDHVVAYLVVMALVDGSLDQERIGRVSAFADALGVDEPAVADLRAAVSGHLDVARADMVRRNLHSITGRWSGTDEDAWLVPYRDHPDPTLEDRYRTLATRSPGTFGRAFADFYAANGFAFPGNPSSANEQFTTPHDSAHVLSGYDTSPQGELLVSTFTAGMHDVDGLAGHVLPVVFSWHLGIELVRFAGSTTGSLDPRKVWVAWERGSELRGDTFGASFDLWSIADEPLDAVRADLGVPPLDPADAADGAYPDWYHPSA